MLFEEPVSVGVVVSEKKLSVGPPSTYLKALAPETHPPVPLFVSEETAGRATEVVPLPIWIKTGAGMTIVDKFVTSFTEQAAPSYHMLTVLASI
jgi:hypothetical protein